jgi:hypothetical protein
VKHSKVANALLSVIVLGCFGQSVNVAAQDLPLSGCQSGHIPLTNKPGWPQGTTVDVYIDPAITGQRLTSVQTAFNTWTGNSGANGSGVTYHYVSTPPPEGHGYRVLNQMPPSGDRAETFTYPDGTVTPTAGAVTYLSPGMTTPAAVLEAMSHEIGHPAGFGHCNDCEPSESIMATKVQYTNDNDVIGRATSPTPCDNQQLYLLNHPECRPAPEGGLDTWCVYCCCWISFGDTCAAPTPECDNQSCALCCPGNHCDANFGSCMPDLYFEGCNISQSYIDMCMDSDGTIYRDCQCHWGGPRESHSH